MAQLAEWSLIIPEVRDSNPVIGKTFITNIYTVNCFKVEINEKEAGNGLPRGLQGERANR